jgi:hypothetical protein
MQPTLRAEYLAGAHRTSRGGGALRSPFGRHRNRHEVRRLPPSRLPDVGRPGKVERQNRDAVVLHHVYQFVQMSRGRRKQTTNPRDPFRRSIRGNLDDAGLGEFGAEDLLPGLDALLPVFGRVSLVDPFPVPRYHGAEVRILIVGTEERRKVFTGEFRVRHGRPGRLHPKPIVEAAHQGLERRRHVRERIRILVEEVDLISEQGRQKHGRSGEGLLDVP